MTDNLIQANISLWAVAVGTLQGEAHVTYWPNSKQEDTESTTCLTVTDIVKPFSWDVKLNGQFFTHPDGSIQISALADPPRGPAYFELFPDGPAVPTRENPGVTWSGIGGQLVKGEYRAHTDNPIPSDATGTNYTGILLWVVR